MPALSNSRLKIVALLLLEKSHAYSFDRSAGALKIEINDVCTFLEGAWLD